MMFGVDVWREYVYIGCKTMKTLICVCPSVTNDEWDIECTSCWNIKNSKSSLILSHLQVSLFSCVCLFAVFCCKILLHYSTRKVLPVLFDLWLEFYIILTSLFLSFFITIKGWKRGRKNGVSKRWNPWNNQVLIQFTLNCYVLKMHHFV